MLNHRSVSTKIEATNKDIALKMNDGTTGGDTAVATNNNQSGGRSASPNERDGKQKTTKSSQRQPRPWSAADSDKCECVLEVLQHDVLLGRGSGPNDHVGNIKFRDLVHERKSDYLSTNHRQTKALIARDIVDQVYARGGRFLKKLNPVESAKMLPKLLAKKSSSNCGSSSNNDDDVDDDPENDFSDDPDRGSSGDVYQIQKHATVMEKAKQALRQNQRNGSLSPTGQRSGTPTKGRSPGLSGVLAMNTNSNANRHSMHPPRTNKISPDPPPLYNNSSSSNNNNNNGNTINNWNGMAMGQMNIPTTLNACLPGDNSSGNKNNGFGNHNNQGGGTTFHNNYDISGPVFSSSQQQQQQSHQAQDSSFPQTMFQQQQQQQQQQQTMTLAGLQQQHDILAIQLQQQQQHLQQFPSQQLQKQILQEQLELQIRQEQVLKIQQQLARSNNTALYSKQQQQDSTKEQQQQFRQQTHQQQQQHAPPSVLNGFATYTTTLEAMKDDRHRDSHQHSGYGDAQEMMLKAAAAMASNNNANNPTASPEKHHHHSSNKSASDDKSMQMSSMMGSFKDMSVRSNDESMHGSGDTIGTIDNIPGGMVGGLAMAHMSGISMMSMMNDDSTDSLFKNPSKAGSKVVGAHNASWNTISSNGSKGNNNAAATSAVVLGLTMAGRNKIKQHSHNRKPDLIESGYHNQYHNNFHQRSAAAAAGAAALGKPMPSSNSGAGGENGSTNSMANAAASAMLAMAAAESQNFAFSGVHGSASTSRMYDLLNNSNNNNQNPQNRRGSLGFLTENNIPSTLQQSNFTHNNNMDGMNRSNNNNNIHFRSFASSTGVSTFHQNNNNSFASIANLGGFNGAGSSNLPTTCEDEVTRP